MLSDKCLRHSKAWFSFSSTFAKYFRFLSVEFKISRSVLAVRLLRNDEQCEHVRLNQTEHLFESENIRNTFCSNVFQCNTSTIPDTLSDEDTPELSPLWDKSVVFPRAEWCGSALRPTRSMVSAYWLIWRESEAVSVGVIHPHILAYRLNKKDTPGWKVLRSL